MLCPRTMYPRPRRRILKWIAYTTTTSRPWSCRQQEPILVSEPLSEGLSTEERCLSDSAPAAAELREKPATSQPRRKHTAERSHGWRRSSTYRPVLSLRAYNIS